MKRVMDTKPQIPVFDSPAYKLLSRGSQALSDVELLSLFMGENVELARTAMLFNFQSWRELFLADEEDFKALGVSQMTYAQLRAVLEICQRWLGEKVCRGEPMTDPDAVRFYLSSRLRDLPSERFCVLFMDNRHRMIAFEELFNGTIDGASVHPREVVKRCLHHNAAAVIFAHNHPSGVPEPSQADERITRRLKETLHLIDVRVLDHFVVGDSIVSMAERGML